MVMVPVSSVVTAQLWRHGFAPAQSKVWVSLSELSPVSLAYQTTVLSPLSSLPITVMLIVSPWLTLVSSIFNWTVGLASLGTGVEVGPAGTGGAVGGVGRAGPGAGTGPGVSPGRSGPAF